MITSSSPKAPLSLRPGSELCSDRVALVVEDHDDTRLMMVWLLESWGYYVLEAENGQEAVQIARWARPEVILMDTGLPGIDGITATMRIREHLHESVRIIFISGYCESAFRARAITAGCDHYLTKPLDIAALAALLKNDASIKIEHGIRL